jgi:hypothetical protein
MTPDELVEAVKRVARRFQKELDETSEAIAQALQDDSTEPESGGQ